MSNYSRYIPKALRERLLNGAVCAVCGTNEALEIDHIIPISRGGANAEDNLGVLCRFHNREKSNKMVEDRVTYFNQRHFKLEATRAASKAATA